MHPPTLLLSTTIRPRRRQVKPLRTVVAPAPRPILKPLEVEAVLLNASGLHWVIALRGDIEAVIEYDARRPGVELVKVDSRVVCREGTLRGYNGRFSFKLPGVLAPVPVELEIANSLWSAVTELRLEVAGVTVLACETNVETCALPVPAGSPAPHRAELPLPHEE